MLKYPANVDCGYHLIGFREKTAGNSYNSWENLWFPVYFPLSQPIVDIMRYSILVGGFNSSENMKVNWDDYSQYRGK